MALDKERLNRFNAQRAQLAGMLDKASRLVEKLNMSKAGENLTSLNNKVNNETFKIQVIGTFKNGKSTFINSLLGENVLPAYALPCTAVINELKYGAQKGALLHFRNPLPENIPACVEQRALDHMKRHGMKDVPPMRIEYGEIEKYVTIPIGGDPKEMMLESPYEKVEVFWPLDMLKEGVEIIDSPGLNEAETRTRVTMDYLTKADAILFVLIADRLCSMTEMDFIENDLQANGFEDPFFIVNKFDIIPDSQKEGIKRYAKDKLKGLSTIDIFFVSAQQALDGEMRNDKALYEMSNMPPLTARLSAFLTNEKGKVKLSQPARELKRILNNEALYKIIPDQRAMLDRSLDDLKNKYEKAKPRLDTLRTEKAQLVKTLTNRIGLAKYEFQRAVESNISQTVNKIPAWVDGFEPRNKFNVVPTKKKTNSVVSEITDHISAKLRQQQEEWKRRVLQPLVEKLATDIFESVEHDLSNLYKEIDSIGVSISGRHEVDANPVPLWQRIAGAAGGLFVGDICLAVSGGINGISKDLIKVATLELGAGYILALLGCLNPFTIVLVILSSVVMSWNSGAAKAMKKTKQLVTDEIVKEISRTGKTNADNVADNLCAKLMEIANGISTAVDNEMHQTEELVQGIIKEMEKGKQNVEKRKAEITEIEKQIKVLNNDLDDFTFALIGQK